MIEKIIEKVNFQKVVVFIFVIFFINLISKKLFGTSLNKCRYDSSALTQNNAFYSNLADRVKQAMDGFDAQSEKVNVISSFESLNNDEMIYVNCIYRQAAGENISNSLNNELWIPWKPTTIKNFITRANALNI